jgi:cytoskeletal protein CcmA (bactofilin family)
MDRIATKTLFTVGLLILLMSVPALGASINKSVKIGAGEESDGATSVNGSITVGESATVTGNLKTVNGTIRVDDGAIVQKASTVNGGLKLGDRGKAEALSTVNGSIRVGEEAMVAGEIEAVNGRITVEKGAHISDNVSNVNGQIDLSGAELEGDLSTVNGDINLADRSVVKGDIIVEEPGGWDSDKEKNRIPRLVIGPGSRVEGTIVLERKVKLFISETAEVGGVSGVMSMDDAVRFSGDRP